MNYEYSYESTGNMPGWAAWGLVVGILLVTGLAVGIPLFIAFRRGKTQRLAKHQTWQQSVDEAPKALSINTPIGSFIKNSGGNWRRGVGVKETYNTAIGEISKKPAINLDKEDGE